MPMVELLCGAPATGFHLVLERFDRSGRRVGAFPGPTIDPDVAFSDRDPGGGFTPDPGGGGQDPEDTLTPNPGGGGTVAPLPPATGLPAAGLAALGLGRVRG